MAALPKTQYAVQLVGPDKLIFNDSKKIVMPGENQILCKVQAVGLCFSDLKLLKQFASHVRKGQVIKGTTNEVLKEISSYVPDDQPTVPGHETVIKIVAVGPGVTDFKVGQRYLVQTDYRWLPTTGGSNASFGYNFEGGLQEYVLIDTRIATSPQGESMMIPVTENLSSSAVALVEPWACVENSYASSERTKIKENGQMLIVADQQPDKAVLGNLFKKYGKPDQITWISSAESPAGLDVKIKKAANVSELADTSFDDVIYFGNDQQTAEAIFPKVAAKGLLNFVLCGKKFGKEVVTSVGRVHYGGIRIIGTVGSDPVEAMKYIPATDEIRTGDMINVVGAGGPMGVMHVMRDICQGVKGVSVFAGDMDAERLESLSKIAIPAAKKNKIQYKTYNPAKDQLSERFGYIAIMVPVPALVAGAVKQADNKALINIFAGIPATVSHPVDLDSYIEKQLYFIGTSGSVLEDMKCVLAKVEAGTLDTNVSVAAVCGLEEATQGIRAVENRLIAGKILVYPQCKGLALTELKDMASKLPNVAKCLNDGLWTKEAEQALLKSFNQTE